MRGKLHNKGFTLVELLVVISVIVLLLGMLMPALNKARQISKRAACKGNLHSIAEALQMYLNDNRNTLPPAGHDPYDMTNITNETYTGRPPVVCFLGNYITVPSNQIAQVYAQPPKRAYAKVLSCPADRNMSSGTQYYGMALFFYKDQSSSFRYDPDYQRNSIQGQSLNTSRRQFRSSVKAKDAAIMADYDSFHGNKPVEVDYYADASSTLGSYNYLYADCHVGDRKGY
jgi:prepilin-type N-terminal cleavage/methylation domain-containing protein/prepilin-type processing-associated H-X9-DG protein